MPSLEIVAIFSASFLSFVFIFLVLMKIMWFNYLFSISIYKNDKNENILFFVIVG